jgi:flagellar basal body-associated protein FliL
MTKIKNAAKHRIILAVLTVSLSSMLFDNSFASEDHITSIKEWEPGLIQGHGNGKFLYYNLPEFIANLETDSKQASFIKVRTTLEAPTKADADAIDANLPLIRDSFSAYLRSLHQSDLTSPKLIKMREELLKSVNTLIAPHKIHDVLFEEILVQ